MGNLSNIAPRCKVGYFLCTEYIFIELATTFALVVCFLTALCAGGSFRSNQSQIVSVRYSFGISAGVANIVRTVIVSRFGCCSIAASTFMPVTCAVAGPSGTPIVTESCDIVNSLGLCICPSFSKGCCIGCFALCCAGRSLCLCACYSSSCSFLMTCITLTGACCCANGVVCIPSVSRCVPIVIERCNLYACFIGNFYRSCCICEPLVTAIAGVVCEIARSSAGGSFRSNQSQIVSVFFVFIFVIICNNRSVRNNRLIQAVNLYKFIIIKCFCRC